MTAGKLAAKTPPAKTAPVDKAVIALSERVDRLEQQAKTDTEAWVISKCVQAIDRLPSTTTGSYNYGAQTSSRIDVAAVLRVLDYLRQRYGLPDPNTEVRRLEADAIAAQQRAYNAESRLSTILSAANGGAA